MSLNLKDFQRFEKQIILKKVGIAGQKKIHQARVLIIGMGGIGCPLLTYLASAGICNIGIVDHDKVEIGNFNRQIIFNSADLGKYKVVKAKSKISKVYKKIKIKNSKLLSEKYTFNATKHPKDKGPFPEYTLWYYNDELLKMEFKNPTDKKNTITIIRKDWEN